MLPRDAKMGTTVEHVKLLRDDITTTNAQNLRDALKETNKVSDDRAMRLEARMSSLESSLSKVVALLEGGARGGLGGRGGVAIGPGGSGSGSGSGVGRERGRSTSNSSMVSGSRPQASHASGE